LKRRRETGNTKSPRGEIKNYTHAIAGILKQAKPQNPKKFLKGILKDLGNLKGILA